MKKILAVVIISLMICVGATQSSATPLSTQQRQTLKVLYSQQDLYLKTKNAARLLAMTDERFQRVEKNGETTGREDEMQYIQRIFSSVKTFVAVRTVVESATVKNRQLVAVARTYFDAVIYEAKGKTRRVKINSTTRDTWVFTNKGWRTLLTESVSQSTMKS